MHALPEQLARFGHSLRTGRDDAMPPALAACFVEQGEIAHSRWLAYRRNVQGNWHAALCSSYPVVLAMLGPACFAAMAHAYMTAHPSDNADLNQLGAAFSEWLAHQSISQTHVYLPELAQLEWALQVTYQAPDPSHFDLAALAACPPAAIEQLQFECWSGACLLSPRYPVAALWEAHQLDEAARDRALAELDTSPGEHPLIASRQDNGQALLLPLTGAEANFWQALQDGRPLPVAISLALAIASDFSPAPVLQRWIQHHFITGFRSHP